MKSKRLPVIWGLVLFLCLIAAIGNVAAEPNNQNNPQIERGKPIFVLDLLGNILSLPQKIILLNFKVDNHNISPKTEQFIAEYIKDNPETMKDTKLRLNQFSLFGDLKRLMKNKKVSWYWRIFPGIPTTIITSLTGRLLGGDNYNPYCDTISIYSDIPAVALHEAGHASDMSRRVKEGWADYYALGRLLPAVTLHQEYEASQEAIDYLREKRNEKEEKDAYKVLIPAYGTYTGSYSGLPYGNIIGAGVGHIISIVPRYNCALEYKSFKDAVWSDEVTRNIKSDLLTKSLIEEHNKIDEKLNKLVLEDYASEIRFEEKIF